jgi:TPP-dependent pyruvate/acetoin dehydrogenase alpha subunit
VLVRYNCGIRGYSTEMATRVRHQAAPATARKKSLALISDGTLRKLYASMLECRMLDARVRALRKLPRRVTSFTGREATAVGIGAHLRLEDIVAATHRSPILDYIKGIPLGSIVSKINADTVSKANGHRPVTFDEFAPLNLLSFSAGTEAQFQIANGIALATRMQSKDNIVVTFSRDAESLTDATREALTFAAARKLPILFVVHNDLRNAGSAESLEEISRHALVSGVPGIPVDSRDVVAVYRVAQEAISRARQGGGPTLIEAVSFPKSIGGKLNTATDSLKHMERYLTGKGLFSEKWKQQLMAGFERKLDVADLR